MSKKKVIEYNGKLSETNPEKSNQDLSKGSQQSDHEPIKNSDNDRDNNFTDEKQDPSMKDYDNDIGDEKNNPNFDMDSDATNDISDNDFDIDDESEKENEDLSDGNNKDNNESSTNDNESPSDLQNNEDKSENDSPSDFHNKNKEGNDKSPSDLHNEEKNSDNNNLNIDEDNTPNEKSDLDFGNDKDIKEESDLDIDNEKEKSGIKENILDSVHPNVSKGLKIKELSEMNKKEAAEQLADTAKSMAKKKIAASIVTYISPILLPLAIIFIILLLVLTIIMTIIAQNNENERMNDAKEGCNVTDKASSNIADSKNATKNAINIYKYTKKNVKGSTNKGIAAWLGNIYVESANTFSSSTIQGGAKYKESIAKDPNAGGYAFGFAQLDSDRRVKLLKYADKKGKKWSDMELQLDYILNHDGTDSPLIKKLIKKDSDMKSITEDIMNQWERAGAKDSISERQAATSKYYSKISKIDSGDSNISDSTSSSSDNSDAGSNSGCNNDSNSKTDGELGDSVKANDKSGTVEKQWKSKDDIPKKYKKYISLPDYKGEKLNSSENIFPSTHNKGQCTELLFSYMSQLWKGKQPTNGNGNVIYKAYKGKGAKTTSNPTVGYGFSSDPPYAGAAEASVGHTGVVIGVMPDGKWLMSNYNLNGEANKDESRVESFALVDGNKKKNGITFFSGIGGAKIKSK